MHACPICCFATSTSICASCARRHEDRCSPLPPPDADEAEVIRWATFHGIDAVAIRAAKLRVRAECTWGDGPDVLVEVPLGGEYAMMVVDGGHSFGMHSGEARTLAAALVGAADQADELERGWIAAGSRPRS